VNVNLMIECEVHGGCLMNGIWCERGQKGVHAVPDQSPQLWKTVMHHSQSSNTPQFFL